ncbi:ABC transporter ATP-binding protein [Fischerella thermalis]|uniref:ABC transporter ATP-binding protein n=1 Tax=Fischerella thermalis TaxID=372787 RepID=UPI001A0E0B37|nr:ABC transporter ATP-binding protein [Fischerella thermalis]MBF2071419.1 ABC transporter ATP-binding protein [Fischerella thermalis M48_A2018_028]
MQGLNELIPRLQVRNITKSYSGFFANNQVNLTIQPGEIHALLGENGAGKSTLMKIIYGVVRPESGEIFWEGKRVDITNPAKARSLGIGMVFQHFCLFETLTVTENISLGLPHSEKWNLAQVKRKIRLLSQEYGLDINPDSPVYTLSVGEKQRVEIIRCLCVATKLLILDEPTAVLTPQETEKLFLTLQQIAAGGCSILFSSHKLQEVRSLCTHATILRNGEVIAECNPQLETINSLARMMIGEDEGHGGQRGQENITLPPPPHHPTSPICFQVRDLCLESKHPIGISLQHINLEVRTGEIVGIAGVAGNGQRELLAALSGEVICPKADMIMLGEIPIGDCDVPQRRRLGLAYIPEERLGVAIVPNMNLLENALLTGYSQGLLRNGMIRQRKLKAWTRRICDAFNVKQAGLNSLAANLSGGNLQKFIVGREIQQNPTILIAAHPSWGVDVNATATIHQAFMEMRDIGAGVLVVSEDLDELLTLCDRIGVIYKGQLSPFIPIADISREKIGRWMGGVSFV